MFRVFRDSDAYVRFTYPYILYNHAYGYVTSINVSIYLFIPVHIYIYIYIYIYVCVSVCLCIFFLRIYLSIYLSIYLCIWVCILLRKCVCARAYVCVCVFFLQIYLFPLFISNYLSCLSLYTSKNTYMRAYVRVFACSIAQAIYKTCAMQTHISMGSHAIIWIHDNKNIKEINESKN